MSCARALCLLLAFALAGCQSYQPDPVNLAAHDAAWRARDLTSAPVTEYARRLALIGPSSKETFDPADGLTVREAEVVALFFNPRLRIARAKARIPAAGAAEAGRWQDPELNIDAERILESVSSPWVLGGTLSVTLPLSGRLDAERTKALAEADSATIAVLVEESAIIAELHERWLELALLDQRIDLTRQYLEELTPIALGAEKLRERGELGPIEAKLFKIEQVRRRTDLRSLELERRSFESAIKAVLGLTADAPVRLIPSMPRALTTVPSALEPRREWLAANHPKLRQAIAEHTIAERTLDLEVRKQFPDLKLGGGYGIDEGTHRLLGGLSLPIPLFNANRRAIAEARASRDLAKASAEAAYEEVVGGLARAEIALDAARQRNQLLRSDLAPLVDEQLRDATKLGKLGDANTVILLEALTRAFETRLELLGAVEKEAQAINRINALLRPATGLAPDASASSPGVNLQRKAANHP